MDTNIFLVAFHRGDWRIEYRGRWYGAYGNAVTAVVSAVRIARASPDTQVMVRKENGSEIIVWNSNP